MEKNSLVYVFVFFIIFLLGISIFLFLPDSGSDFPIFEPSYLLDSVGSLSRHELRNLTLSQEFKRSYVYGKETGFYIFENKFYRNLSDERRERPKP